MDHSLNKFFFKYLTTCVFAFKAILMSTASKTEEYYSFRFGVEVRGLQYQRSVLIYFVDVAKIYLCSSISVFFCVVFLLKISEMYRTRGSDALGFFLYFEGCRKLIQEMFSFPFGITRPGDFSFQKAAVEKEKLCGASHCSLLAQKRPQPTLGIFRA